MIAQLAVKDFESREASAAQNLNELFELQAHLMNQLLALIEIDLRVVAGESIARPADGKALFIQQTANLPDDQHVLALVIAPVTAPLDRFELREFLLPVAKHVRLDAAQVADLADREVALPRNRRQIAIVAWFQHMPRRAPSVSDQDEM